MTELPPLDVFFDAAPGEAISLPSALERIYGPLAFPPSDNRQHTVANFVETLDGVVSLEVAGKSGGGPISGFNKHDRFIMGLLRSVADAVVVGAGTLRSVPQHIWTAEHIFPSLAGDYAQLRAQLGKPAHPLNVIVSASGALTADFAILNQTDVPVHVFTTSKGAQKMQQSLPHVELTAAAGRDAVPVVDILRSLTDMGAGGFVLLETGPQLTGQFLAEGAIHELFLSLAPQIAGRNDGSTRPGLVSDHLFAPDDSRWAELVSVRRGEDHLFLRYSFQNPRDPGEG